MAYWYQGPTDADGMTPVPERPTPVPRSGDGGGGGTSSLYEQACLDARRDCLANCPSEKAPHERKKAEGGGEDADLANCRRSCNDAYNQCHNSDPDRARALETGRPGDCGLGATEAYEGCECGRYYNLANSGESCRAGYVKVMADTAPNGARCECQKWCQEIGYAADCTTKLSEGGGKLGEYAWPEELSSFYKNLMGRGQELLGMPLGYSPEAQAAAFGQGFEKVRGQERGARESLLGELSREGMLGTGASLGAMKDLAWGTEKNISDIQRDLFIQNELQKKKDIQDYTGLANTLFGQGMGYNQIQEAINAARRGEGSQALALWLALLGQMGELA